MVRIMKLKKTTIKIFYICSIILMFFSALYIIKYFYNAHSTQKQSELLNEIEIAPIVEAPNENTENDNIIDKPERILKLEELQKENPEIVAWIEIENTNINYPVLQCSNNDFYMNHNYQKKYASSGSLFLDKDYSWNSKNSNLLIYGHNMKDGTMFQNLLNYSSQSYYYAHPNIRFTTNAYDANFEIISAFRSRVYNQSDTNVFKYYYYTNIKSEEEFNEYAKNVKQASLYDTGKQISSGDTLITLSTCSYHTNNGRFVVVAKKVLD